MSNLKKLFTLMMAAICSYSASIANDDVIVSTWNPKNVLLPASQFTPTQRWSADVMVFNTGQEYADAYYNKVWGTPNDDSEGRHWYEPDYKLTNGAKEWEQQTAPFSSDETYIGQKSYRWITTGIMGEIYLRRTFTLSSQVLHDIFLACGHDDSPSEYYINGTLVFTSSDGWNNEEHVLLTAEQKALIKTDGSENVLAVHVHQNWGGAYADCGLYEADMRIENILLPTLGNGPWPCSYYLLNKNEELSKLNPKQWTGRCVIEDDWAMGYGPFSNSPDMFLTTGWGSDRLPLLIRRHFSLSASDLATINENTYELMCSYDENPKIYLNGTLIWSATGWNDNDYAHYILTKANKALLKEGDNVLAVSLTAGNGGGHIDYGLSITKPYVPSRINDTKSVLSSTLSDMNAYDLNGRRISSLATAQKGIYIVNGKKIIK
ncbi:hypothetical protein L6475_03825 [Prevotella sp. E9-3]|uniref:hypothetical protein n=1 Tax=Prevotella sp. E9-3 TaxID=2913621 RepID=UPI001ED9F82F|nr:hypothetical protein [Prevotella sp. E9-3]UKK49100.1 hypothetical protein L6475_03825 [Prevotella sp. E9-3]